MICIRPWDSRYSTVGSNAWQSLSTSRKCILISGLLNLVLLYYLLLLISFRNNIFRINWNLIEERHLVYVVQYSPRMTPDVACPIDGRDYTTSNVVVAVGYSQQRTCIEREWCTPKQKSLKMQRSYDFTRLHRREIEFVLCQKSNVQARNF